MASAPSTPPEGHYAGTPQHVVFGPGSIGALAGRLDELAVRRPMLVCGPTVAASPLLDAVTDNLGGRDVVVFDGARPHAPRSACRAGLELLRAEGADSMISIGGSSPVDVMRGIALLEATGRDFDELVGTPQRGATSMLPLVAITTTLSQAEFSNVVGVTNDDADGEKFLWFDRGLMPSLVVLDGELTLHTPERLWLSTAVKALDTLVDLYLEFVEPQPFWQGMLDEALVEQFRLLPQTRSHPDSVSVRQQLQIAAWMSEFPRFHLPVDASRPRASRWFGAVARHQLGGRYGVPHGELAGIIFPTALAFHAVECGPAEDRLAMLLGLDDRAALPSHFRDLVAHLGLPTTLAEVGVPSADFDGIVSSMLTEEAAYGIASVDGHRERLIATLQEMVE